MKVELNHIGGEEVKNNETYVLTDNNYLEHMTLSKTYLKPGKSTRGHSHDSQEEVYIFTKGEAFMQIGETYHHAKEGNVFLIKAGEFHRVFNKSEQESCSFTCVFEKYDRSGDEAKY